VRFRGSAPTLNLLAIQQKATKKRSEPRVARSANCILLEPKLLERGAVG
jgi:hypothetical protein